MIIVDSTIWIHYLRSPDTSASEELVKLLNTEQVVMVGAVLAEVLQGTRGEREFTALQPLLTSLTYLEVSKQTWVKTGELSMRLRRQGQPIPLSDLLIAALALEADHELYTLDDHFQRVPGLKLHQIEASRHRDV